MARRRKSHLLTLGKRTWKYSRQIKKGISNKLPGFLQPDPCTVVSRFPSVSPFKMFVNAHQKVYSPRYPRVKSFRSSPTLTPCKLNSPLKKKKILKRKQVKSPYLPPVPKTPSKSPSLKRTKRSLSASLTECKSNDTNFSQLNDIDELTLLSYENTIQISDIEKFIDILGGQSDSENLQIGNETLEHSAESTSGNEDIGNILNCDLHINNTANFETVRTTNNKLIENSYCASDRLHIEAESKTDGKAEDTSSAVEEMIKLVPSVLTNLEKEGISGVFLEFFRQVEQNKFPLKNIALQLWLEVVKWFSLNSTTEMRYSEETKKFWKLGYLNFGGKFVHFMSGYKNAGQVIERDCKLGSYPTEESAINFAVPSATLLQTFDPYETNNDNDLSEPGIFEDVMKTMAKAFRGKSCCVTFDGKKLKQGLTKTSGDVNLLGFESGISLREKQEEHSKLIAPVLDLVENLRAIENLDTATLPDEQINEIKKVCAGALNDVSKHILKVREIRKKKVYAKEKLIERSEEPTKWKNGKFAYAISAIIAYIHDIDMCTEKALSLVDELIRFISYIQGARVVNGDTLDLDRCSAYHQIGLEGESNDTRRVKQRSDRWFAARKDAQITGSTIYAAIGLDGLKAQRQHYDQVVCGLPEPDKSDKVRENMAYGTYNEPNAIATIVGKVGPVLFPNTIVCEEGYIQYGNSTNMKTIISPDGSLKTTDGETISGIEVKCPVLDVHVKFPQRYLLQCLAEIESLDVDQLVYLSWRPDISAVYIVKKNTELFSKAYDIAKSLYGVERPKRLTKVSDAVRQLQKEIEAACECIEIVEFKMIVPSIKHSKSGVSDLNADRFNTARVVLMMETTASSFEQFYEINRQPASEAVVFLLCDLDREWSEESVRTAPICWFPKGYSLDGNTMRKILETVLDVCKKNEIHVPALSFDGQWHNICVRGDDDDPLTIFQLQKDVWRKVEKTKKTDILREIKQLNREPRWRISEELHDDGADHKTEMMKKVIITDVTIGRLPSFSPRILQQRKVDLAKQKERNTVQNENDFASDFIEAVLNGGEAEEDRLPEVNEMDDDTNQYDSEVKISEQDAEKILSMLKLDDKSNKKGKWNNESSISVLKCFESADNLKKMTDADVKIVVRYLNSTYLKEKIKESGTKQNKLAHLYKVFGLQPSIATSLPKSKKHTVKKLSELAFNQVSKMKKSELNIVYAEYIWHAELQQWLNERPAITHASFDSRTSAESVVESNESDGANLQATLYQDLDNSVIPKFWFYYPNVSGSRGQLEVSCIDSTHLLTRTRRKCCRGGIEGLSNEPWRNVAKRGNTLLTLAVVDGVLEPMSVSVARCHFTEEVENDMRIHGDIRAADLCRDIRQWWYAEDDPGINSKLRIQQRMSLRKRLLSYVNFAHFPPPTMYINGWPCQLWEALIANIDAKTHLYGLTHSHTYNVRAFSSMMGETYFSELTMFDRRGRGTVTAAEFGRFICSTWQALNMRLDPERSFYYRTSRKTVYKLVDKSDMFSQNGGQMTDDADDVPSDKRCTLDVKNHHFDLPERNRVACRKKVATMSTDRNAVKRGSLGVRWESSAWRNESKILPTVRMGLDNW